MDIFIIREGRQTGPFSEDTVKAQLTEGSVRPVDMGWRKGMAEWRPLSEVLKTSPEKVAPPATTPPAEGASPDGASAKGAPATAKQKVFLKYLGVEFDGEIGRERAALEISDALENPKLQPRIRKWHDERLRLHADVFKDEIDYRRANRSGRYLERVQTEGADVLKDVTKAHVQVLVESLDKRHPDWESDRESALWDYLIPAVGEHFPQLVLPAYKGRLKLGVTARSGGSTITRSTLAAAGVAMRPTPTPGTFSAMWRGVVLGVIALGAIIAGKHYWEQFHSKGAAQVPAAPGPVTPEKNQTPPPENDPAVKEPAAKPPEKPIAEAKTPDAPPESPPIPVPPNDPPAIPAPPEEKPATPVPAPAPPTETPAMAPAPAALAPVAPAPPRTAVKLIQGIGVMLQNGQVTLPAGTPLRYLGTEGKNVRVSWNNNIFFVPAAATDVNEPVPAPLAPAATAPASATPAPAKKPADDL